MGRKHGFECPQSLALSLPLLCLLFQKEKKERKKGQKHSSKPLHSVIGPEQKQSLLCMEDKEAASFEQTV